MERNFDFFFCCVEVKKVCNIFFVVDFGSRDFKEFRQIIYRVEY